MGLLNEYYTKSKKQNPYQTNVTKTTVTKQGGTTGGGSTGLLRQYQTKNRLNDPFQIAPVKKVANTKVTVTSPQTKAQPPAQPFKHKPSNPFEVAGNILKTAKSLDYDRIKIALTSGTKTIPGMTKTGGSIIAEAWVKQQQALDNFFKSTDRRLMQMQNPLVKSVVLGNKLLKPVKEIAYKKVSETAPALKEQGMREQTEAAKPFTSLKPSSNKAQWLTESLAFNLPQMAASTALTIGTGLVTKNPAIATAVGFSSSYGMGANEIYMTARQNGLTDKDAQPLAMMGGLIVGALDFIPFERLLRKTGAVEPIKRKIVQKIADQLVSTSSQALFEGTTEMIQEIVQNAIEQTYNENKNLLEGVAESGFVGMLMGGISDVGVGSISALGGKSKTPEQLMNEVNKQIEDAVQTPKEKRSVEQQEIVDAVLTKQVTPDDAVSIIVDQKLGNTKEGKQIMQAVLDAKATNKEIKIVTTEEGDIAMVDLVDPNEAPKEIERTELDYKGTKDKTGITIEEYVNRKNEKFRFNEPSVLQKDAFRQVEDNQEGITDVIKRYEEQFGDMAPETGAAEMDLDLYSDAVKFYQLLYGAKRNPPSNISEVIDELKDGMRGYLGAKERGTSEVPFASKYRIKDDFSKKGIEITEKQEQEITALNKEIFGDDNIKITAQALTNSKALGEYRDGMIKILNGQADAKDTYFHEVVHKYLDAFTDKTEYMDIILEGDKLYNLNDFAQVEERIAEDFINYAKSRTGTGSKLKLQFDKIILRIKQYFENSSKIEKLYNDILTNKPTDGKEVAGDLQYKKSTLFTDEKRRGIETKFAKKLGETYQEAKTEYEKRFGNVLSTDNARELSEDYMENKAENSVSTHEPARAFVEKMYEEKLNESDPSGNNIITFTGGGTGAGKTTATTSIAEAKGFIDASQLVYDTTLQGFSSATEKVEQALSKGKKVVILYVHRDPIESFENGVIPRAITEGRTVPYKFHTDAHINAPETMRKLIEKYGDNIENFGYGIIDNTRGKDNASTADVAILNNLNYNKEEINKRIVEIIEEKYSNGEISQQIYNGLKGNDSTGNSKENGAGSSQQPQQSGKEKVSKTSVSKETPTGTGRSKNSQLFERIKETLGAEYESKQIKYNELKLGQQADSVVKLVEENPEKAVRIARGLEEPIPGTTQNAFAIALAELAVAKGDYNTAADMWTKTSLRNTRLGQELVTLRGAFAGNESLNAVKQILTARLERVSRRYSDVIKGLSTSEKATTVQKVDALVKHQAKVAKKEVTKRQKSIQSAQDILNELMCKV